MSLGAREIPLGLWPLRVAGLLVLPRDDVTLAPRPVWCGRHYAE